MQGGPLDYEAKQPAQSFDGDDGSGDGDGGGGDSVENTKLQELWAWADSDFPHLIEKDLLIEAKGVAIKEWWVANEHLIEEDAKRPPVDSLVVTTRLSKS